MPSSDSRTSHGFASTQWSLVIAAGRQSSPAAKDALALLCKAYWAPLYAYVRRRGYSVADAQDLTQEFFTRLIEKNYLKSATPDRGRFRSFLLGSMKHFLINEWDRSNAKKRGGGAPHMSFEFADAETALIQDAFRKLTPEELFERRWALAVIDRALARLEREFVRAGKSELFNSLKAYLVDGSDGTSYAEMAILIGTSEGAVKVSAHRMRRRFRELLRAEIARTVATAEEIDDEVRHLIDVLGS